MPQKREPGYYWASIHERSPEVARWNGLWWEETGEKGGIADEHVRVISEKLVPPS
jgi:hypothetical protein